MMMQLRISTSGHAIMAMTGNAKLARMANSLFDYDFSSSTVFVFLISTGEIGNVTLHQ
jgi:hypothetical protein